MADRTTKVNLVANVSGYLAGMKQAAAYSTYLGTEAERAARKLAAQRQGFEAVGRSLLAVGALAAAGVGLAIKSFADFDAKMSQVATLSHATTDEMVQLTTAALHMGQAIGFSATEVADAETELVKAGISVADIMGGALQGALQLAAAGQIDVAQATEIATIAMTQFGLKGAQIPHVADLLTAGADKALGGVGDLGEALKSGGLIADQFGVSLEETIGTLSAFANAGLIGETAGTDLRQMLLKLAAPAADAQKVMDELGISIYDQGGKFVGLANLSGQLHDKLVDQTEATRNADLATIFGARAIAGANVLYKEGADGIANWTNEVNDSGFAAEQAAGKMDNLKGDISKLEAAFNTGLIEAGSGANDVLRSMTQILTGLVSGIANLPEPVLAATLGLGALVAIIGIVGGTALIAVPQVARFKEGLTPLGITGRGAAIGVGAVSGALAVAGIVLAIFAQAQAEATANTQEFQASLDKSTGALTGYTSKLVAKKLAESGAFEQAKRVGVSQKELTTAVLEGGSALEAVQAKLRTFASANIADNSLGLQGAARDIGDLNSELGQSKQNLKDEAAAAAGAVDPNQSASAAYKSAADKAAELQANLTSLIDTINKANGVGQDAVSTNASYRQAIADVAATIADIDPATGVARKGVDALNRTVDESTASGAKNADMFSDLAAKSQAAAKAQLDLDGNVQTYQASLSAGRDAMYQQILDLTGSADAAQALTDKIYAMPTVHEIQILVDTQNAQDVLDSFIQRNGNHSITVGLDGTAHGFAGGGYTPGHTTVTTVGEEGVEFVSVASAVAKPANRAALEYMNAGGDIGNYRNAWAPAPAYQAAPAAMYAPQSAAPAGSHTSVQVDVTGVDSAAGAELVYQRLASGLATKK